MENDIKKFINFVVSENLVKAKEIVNDLLNEKLSTSLSTKFDQYAPTVFEEAKPDFLDLDKDGDTEEPMKQAAAQAEEDNEDVEETEDEEQSEEEEESDTEDENAEEDEEDSEEEED